ncbi:farnesyl-diphosphate farnesyltransferase [Amycolatopsis lexingtonensis]|uniref:Farnesyl-diphosphate farnesyltransferase n=1 Tax=Amycolatopsis lexingtonensis TaxID=218822 RepID=A0ABR9HZB0_9PSEU|nr:squalene/phytoene synthase family protein [Amycolatopsis lexingtonensis]MBE1496270.1 farnesyl-diphosphate farnesyltransferase [Amycolatopsis lexingtonensis]
MTAPALVEAHRMLRRYSTTWYEPTLAMPAGLDEAITGAYLCLRAIDEIEDHPELGAEDRSALLEGVARTLESSITDPRLDRVFAPHRESLPEVTLRLAEWAAVIPDGIEARALETVAVMAARMSAWCRPGVTIRTEQDLDRYTYAVSGTVVMLYSDFWSWYDGTDTDRTNGLHYGRALQAGNIYLDHDEDLTRGADYWPNGWHAAEMIRYIRSNLAGAQAYIDAMPEQSHARRFFGPPLQRYLGKLAEVRQTSQAG